jgi:hypothetical protein
MVEITVTAVKELDLHKLAYFTSQEFSNSKQRPPEHSVTLHL